MEGRKKIKRSKAISMKDVAANIRDDLMVWKKGTSDKAKESVVDSEKKSMPRKPKIKQFSNKSKDGKKKTFKSRQSFSKRNTTIKNLIALSQEENKLMKLSVLDDEDAPEIPIETLRKYQYRQGRIDSKLKTKNVTLRYKALAKDAQLSRAEELAARTEILRGEEAGFLEADPGESTDKYTQNQIQKAVDITSATKHFQLFLDMGPYRMNYTKDGRYLLIGGKKGHLAAFDWMTKKLITEVGVMEDVYDVKWLHRETMFAAAQKQYVYIYDRSGVELHCMRNVYRPLAMTFLPYHMLLVTASDTGFLSWLDTSMGSLVTNTKTLRGRSSVLTQNPQNAVVCLGDSKGVVTMWSPSLPKPLVSQFCHRAPVRAITVDHTGTYMVTGGANRQACVWDLRRLGKPLYDLRFDGASPSHLAFSQSTLLAVALDNVVEVYRDVPTKGNTQCYLRHRAERMVSGLEFASWEDVLGAGTVDGFTSLLIPGAGEPSVDGLVGQPLASKQQRREAEVRALLDKLPPNTITLDPNAILKPHVPTSAQKLEAAAAILTGKAAQSNLKMKKKTKRKVHASKAKSIVKATQKKEFVKEVADMQNMLLEKAGLKNPKSPKPLLANPLERFLPKNKK